MNEEILMPTDTSGPLNERCTTYTFRQLLTARQKVQHETIKRTNTVTNISQATIDPRVKHVSRVSQNVLFTRETYSR